MTPQEHAIAAACEAWEVPRRVLLGRSHVRRVVDCRAWAAQLMRADGLSLPQIGRALRRHHTTVLHLLKRFELPADVQSHERNDSLGTGGDSAR